LKPAILAYVEGVAGTVRAAALRAGTGISTPSASKAFFKRRRYSRPMVSWCDGWVLNLALMVTAAPGALSRFSVAWISKFSKRLNPVLDNHVTGCDDERDANQRLHGVDANCQ